jgi:hypothetical protein
MESWPRRSAFPVERAPLVTPWRHAREGGRFPGSESLAPAAGSWFAGLQRRLLESEGIVVEGRTIDMKRHLWSPPKNRPRGRKRKGARHRSFALKS